MATKDTVPLTTSTYSWAVLHCSPKLTILEPHLPTTNCKCCVKIQSHVIISRLVDVKNEQPADNEQQHNQLIDRVRFVHRFLNSLITMLRAISKEKIYKIVT